MQLARADSYINVYLPREDGADPRRYAPPNSPVFDSETVYKFSDQVMKDRPLFLDKKTLTLYNFLTPNTVTTADNSPRQESARTQQKERTIMREGTNLRENTDARPGSYVREGTQNVGNGTQIREGTVLDNKANDEDINLPSIGTVKLALDSQGRRIKPKVIPRFNEPLNAYVANRKRAEHILQHPSLQYSLHRRSTRSRQRLVYNSYQNSQPVVSKTLKSRSASDTRTLGLPRLPDVQKDTRMAKSAYIPMNLQVSSSTTSTTLPFHNEHVNKGMPLRPSSKPNKIWRQSTQAFLEKPHGVNRSLIFLNSIEPTRTCYETFESLAIK